jgi:hypothetical protein
VEHLMRRICPSSPTSRPAGNATASIETDSLASRGYWIIPCRNAYALKSAFLLIPIFCMTLDR